MNYDVHYCDKCSNTMSSSVKRCDDPSIVKPQQTADSCKVVTTKPDYNTDDVTQSVNMEQSKDVEMNTVNHKEDAIDESCEDDTAVHADLNKLCRMCAKKIRHRPVPILGSKPNLADQIFRYFKVLITGTDALPTHICYPCHSKLIECMKIDGMVQHSQRILTTQRRKRRLSTSEPIRHIKKIILNKTDTVKTYSKRERLTNIVNENMSSTENCNFNETQNNSKSSVESNELIHELKIVKLENACTEEDFKNMPIEDSDPLFIESEINTNVPEIVSDYSLITNLKSSSEILSNNSGEKSMEINVNKPNNVNSNLSKDNTVISMNYESNNMALPKLTPAPQLIQNKNVNIINSTGISSYVHSSQLESNTDYVLPALNPEQVDTIINSQEIVSVPTITLNPEVIESVSQDLINTTSIIKNVNTPTLGENIQVKTSSLLESVDNSLNNVKLEENKIKIIDVKSLLNKTHVDEFEFFSIKTEQSVQIEDELILPSSNSIHNSF